MGGLHNSITEGRANTAGLLSEIALCEHLGAVVVDTFNHDLILERRGKRYCIEVKTKRRIADPRSHYEVSVARTSNHQHPDYYAFVSITFGRVKGTGKNRLYYNPKRIWLCGYYRGDRYWQDAKEMSAGEVDNANGFVVHVPMYNMRIDQLIVPK